MVEVGLRNFCNKEYGDHGLMSIILIIEEVPISHPSVVILSYVKEN